MPEQFFARFRGCNSSIKGENETLLKGELYLPKKQAVLPLGQGFYKLYQLCKELSGGETNQRITLSHRDNNLHGYVGFGGATSGDQSGAGISRH